VMLATFMEGLNTTVVNVSIPLIAHNLASPNEQGSWASPRTWCRIPSCCRFPSGRQTPWGPKRLLLTCVAGFTVTSLGCGLATSTYAADYFSRTARAYRRRTAAAGPGDSSGNSSQGVRSRRSISRGSTCMRGSEISAGRRFYKESHPRTQRTETGTPTKEPIWFCRGPAVVKYCPPHRPAVGLA
jgi:hypothetical protein